MKNIFCWNLVLLLSMVTAGCAGKSFRKPVDIYLDPVHRYSSVRNSVNNSGGIQRSKIGDSKLVDNDGNEYWQYWDLRGKSKTAFNTVVQKCKAQFRHKRLYYTRRKLSDIAKQDIKPTLFVEFGNCIREAGYDYISGDGFTPDKYRLTILKHFSKFGQDVPIGAEFFLSKKNVSYIQVYTDVGDCEKKALGLNEYVSEDKKMAVFKKVSIKPFAKLMLSCLAEYAYHIVDAKSGDSPD